MYNLTVSLAHTFFVGDGQWLVHNACPIFGNVQKGATAAHNAKMTEMANELANSGNFEEVWLDTRVRVSTQGQVQSLREPDVLGLNFTTRQAHVIEIPSPTQRYKNSYDRSLISTLDWIQKDFLKYGWSIKAEIIDP